MNREDKFKALLRTAGERVTTPRLGVFRALVRHAPISMAQLIARAQADGIDTVTTYRTVDLFRKLAILQEVGLGRNRLLELSDQYQAHHHHFSCINCGMIIDFDNAAIERELQQIGKTMGLEVHSHQLETTGLCQRCQAMSQL